MLDIKLLRDSPQMVKESLAHRGGCYAQHVDDILSCDALRREVETQKQHLQSQRNALSKTIGGFIKEGKTEQAEATKQAVRALLDSIESLDKEAQEASEKQEALLLALPNMPHEACPLGLDESANPVVRSWGEKPHIEKALDHVALGERHGFFDFEAAVRITGSGFCVYKGVGARLQRALISFLLDTHSAKNGYTEVNVPHIVKRECMEGTGQLPKFEEDMYGVEENTLFLAPTAEVPVTNLYRESLLSYQELPICQVAYTPCFRREAGSAGRDNRGIIRMHQFDKVELVQIAHPAHSFEVLEELTGHAEGILQALGLHYRVIELCSGDLGFSSRKTYDIEVWSPGQEKYLEVSSCSLFGDFQARRMQLRYKDEEGKNHFCHTLNGSGTALPRLVVALIEQCQQPDGSILLPEVLAPYMGGLLHII